MRKIPLFHKGMTVFFNFFKKSATKRLLAYRYGAVSYTHLVTVTGDTICDEAHPVILESMEFPEPVIELAIEPKTKKDQGKMGEALRCV